MPSISLEGFGLVILEAIRFGSVPIVSNKAGGGKDWLSSLDENLIYDSSVEDLNRAINYVQENYDHLIQKLYESIKIFDRNKVAEKFIYFCKHK